MFKKLADLFFEDVEVEEEELIPVETVEVKPERVEAVKKKYKPETPKEEVKVEAVEEEVEQKTFVEPKEKSIFINNTVEPSKKVEKKVETKAEKQQNSYRFTPVISPITGMKKDEQEEYEVKTVTQSKPRQQKSHLGTVISPIFGVPKDEYEDEDELVEEVQSEEVELIGEGYMEIPVEIKEEETINVELPSRTQFVNLTLDDLLAADENVLELKDKVHFFIGIKGTGMSALANLLHDAGYKVMGSDTTNYVFTEVELKEKGIEIVPFGADRITSDMVVVRGNSFYPDHVDVINANNVSAKMYDYPEYLGMFIEDYVSVAVSGSHGKTTTTSMISDMLKTHKPTGFLIGDGRGEVEAGADTMVIEACEYKRHFLSYKADYAVVTNLEWDHVDYFHTVEDYILAFKEFTDQIKIATLVFGDDPYAHELKNNPKVMFYGEAVTNDIYAKNIIEDRSGSSFDIVLKGKEIGNFKINRTGRHMVHNAIATIGIGLLLGLTRDEINTGLARYEGARRRFEVTEVGESVVIDDYAHHPTEVQVTLDAARARYPEHKLVAVYHPDRIKRLETFKDDYISALKTADYAAIGSAVDSDGMTAVIDTSVLTDNISNSFNVDDNAESVEKLAMLTPAVFVFMGTKEMHHLKVNLIDYLKKIDI